MAYGISAYGTPVNTPAEEAIGTGTNAMAFAGAMLVTMGAPVNNANMASMIDWFAAEDNAESAGQHADGTGQNNPLDITPDSGTFPGTTGTEPSGVPGHPGNYDFDNPEDGINGMVYVIVNGPYSAIYSALKSGAGLIGNSSVSANLSSWSGAGYSSLPAAEAPGPWTTSNISSFPPPPGGGGGGGSSGAPPYATSTSNTVTSAAYTPTAGALEVAIGSFGNGDGNSLTAVTLTDTSGSGSWTLLKQTALPDTGPYAGVWCRTAWTTGSATVTLTGTASTVTGVSLQIIEFTGAAPPASQPGATTITGPNTAFSAAITPSQSGSWIVGGFGTNFGSEALTANSVTTILGQYDGDPNGDTVAAIQNTNSPTAGTPITLGFTNTPEDFSSLTLVEILLAATVVSGTAALVVSATAAATAAVSATGFDTFNDQFPGTTINPQWTAFGSAVAFNNQLQIPVSTSGAQYSGVYTTSTWNLIGNELYVNLASAGNQAEATLSADFILYYGSSVNALVFDVTDGTISAWYDNASVQTVLHTATYSATAHAWLKISESGGTITFATAPDGVTWTTFTTVADTTVNSFLTLGDMNAQLMGSTSGTLASASQINWADVNVSPAVTHTCTAALTVTATGFALETLSIPGQGSTAALTVPAAIAATARTTKPVLGTVPVRATINASMSNLGKHQLLLSLAPVAGTDTFGNTYVPGLAIYQAPAGIFIYTGPPELGNLIFSTAPAGFVDPVGNVVTAGLQVGLTGSAVSADLMGNLTVDGNLNVLGTITGNSDEAGILAAIAALQVQVNGLQTQLSNILNGNVTFGGNVSVGGTLMTGGTITSGANVEGTNSSMTGHTDATELNCITINAATIPCAVVDSISDSGVTASEVNDVVTAIIHSLKGAGLMT